MSRMVIEKPEKYDVDYLEEHAKDPGWVDFVVNNYLEILDTIEHEDIPFACRLLISPILDEFEDKEVTHESTNYMQKAINIARIGINSLSDKVGDRSIVENHIIYMDLKGDLFLLLGICLMNIHRPISALENLNFAERSYQIIGDILKDNTEFSKEMDIMYECCRAKEAEFYNKILYEIPANRRCLFANIAHSYMFQAILNLEGYGDEENVQKNIPILKKCERDCYRCFDANTEYEISEMNIDTITDDYQRWCQENYRYLTIMNEVTHNCARYAKDDLVFPLEERYQWQLEDILHTYDHCRRILYRISKIPPEEFINKDRDEDIECLMDCYTRLYTLLDKTAKIINALFPADYSRTDLTFYYVADSLKDSSNPYLRAIFIICKDIFPDGSSIQNRTFDTRGNINGLVFKKGFIRNTIMHNTVKICKESEERGVYEYVASLKPIELFVYTRLLSDDVREILLTLQLAVEYAKNCK